MYTKVIKANKQAYQLAGDLIKKGEIIGMPTETVYGLAADGFNTEAVKKIFLAKGRPQDNPLIVHISDLKMLNSIVSYMPKTASMLADNFWPGALTIIMKKSDLVLDIVTAGLNTVAVRFPSNKHALEIINAAGTPLVAPSANISGSPSPTTANHVYNDLNGKIPLIVDGGVCQVGVESTVVSADDDSIKVLRPGAVTVEMLIKVCKNVQIDKSVFSELDPTKKASSPGMKYKHYSPKANVILVDSNIQKFAEFINNIQAQDILAVVFEGEQSYINANCIVYPKDPEKQAHELFSVLRDIDKIGAQTVYVRCPDKTGVGLAVYNRLIRAAGFEIIKL